MELDEESNDTENDSERAERLIGAIYSFTVDREQTEQLLGMHCTMLIESLQHLPRLLQDELRRHFPRNNFSPPFRFLFLVIFLLLRLLRLCLIVVRRLPICIYM